MSLQTIFIIFGILCVVAILINLFAMILEKTYKNKMKKKAEK